MRFEWQAPEGCSALVFPGQGAQGPGMLDPFRHAPSFPRLYDLVCTLVDRDLLAALERGSTALTANAESSLLTVLASVLALDLIRDAAPEFRPAAVGGYSVGQWTALHAAGSLSADDLLRAVFGRARAMDECVARVGQSAMLAVIGVPAADVHGVCEQARRRDLSLYLANDNAPGQMTLAGNAEGIAFAEVRLRALRPKRLLRPPVAGGWHSPLMQGAVADVGTLLETMPLQPPAIPVLDNTTGSWLPTESHRLREALARHVAAPVLWRQGVQTLVAAGVRTIVEVGYGDMLSRFGFFIDRSVRHFAIAPPPRVSA